MTDLKDAAEKFASSMEKLIKDQGDDGSVLYFRILKNTANNAESNFRKNNFEKALSHLVILNFISDIGVPLLVEKIKMEGERRRQ